MTKIKHPTIERLRLDVSATTVDDWLAMGWLLQEAPPPQPDSPRTPLTAGFKSQEASTS